MAQKRGHPNCDVVTNTAASGISMTSDRYSTVMPSEREKPGSTLWLRSSQERRGLAAADDAAERAEETEAIIFAEQPWPDRKSRHR